MVGFIDQYVIQKGDNITCVFGGFSPNSQLLWSCIVGDYLFDKFSESSRFDLVSYVSFDTRVKDINIINMNSHSNSKKINIFDASSYWKENDLNTLIEQIQKSEVSKQQELDLPIVNSKPSHAIVIHSLSEMIIRFGFTRTLCFIEEVADILQISNVNINSSSVESKKKNQSCLILVIHQSLHTPQMLTRIQNIGNINLFIKPNLGLFDKQILFEIYCIRRSQDSGKIIEDSEFFQRKSKLTSLDSRGVLIESVNKFKDIEYQVNDTSNQIKELSFDNPMDKLLKQSERELENTNTKRDAVATTMTTMKQLVTYDTNDPEFDDEDDPDDDLDL